MKRLSTERPLEQRLLSLAKGESQSMLLALRCHFFPRFLQGVNHFVFRSPARQIRELVLEKNQAKGVLQDSALRILREVLFQIQPLNALNDFIRIANFAQDLP